MGFAHLHNHSWFSFQDGTPAPEAIVKRAAELGMDAVALTDHDNVSGAVRLHRAALDARVKPIQGAEVTLEGGSHIVLLAKSPAGYAALCRIITSAHLNNPGQIDRKNPRAPWHAVVENARDMFCLSGCRRGEVARLLLKGRYREAKQVALRLRDAFGAENTFLEMQNTGLPLTTRLNRLLAELAEHIGIGIVATNNCHYLTRDDFPVHDVLTCIRTLTTLEDIHPERPLNARNHMASGQEMGELFREYPEALRNTELIAQQCEPALDLQRSLFPRFQVPEGESAFSYLYKLVFAGARKRYGRLTPRIRDRLMHELDIICRLGFQEYFLVVWDVVRFARSKGIRYAGRGSAADSAVAYCLGITDVDSIRRGLLFERFLSLERAQKPDIDIDFDARYRDEVTRYVYQKYGKDKVATVCTFNTYHIRSAVRDVGKAMGFPEAEIDRLAKRFPHVYPGCPAWNGSIDEALQKVPELRDSGIPFERYHLLFGICARLDRAPRFMGTHLGGVVISGEPLTNVTPLQMAAKGVVVTQFDKDSIEDLGLVKLDLLSLRMLSAVEDTVTAVNQNARCEGRTELDYSNIPLDDKETYALLRSGETVGAFQLESPAQRALQSRLGADNIEDVVASVALIRPGPIEGNMVEPFVRRRTGLERVAYLHPKLRPILEKTYGVVLYQEQVIEIATAVAGFTPGEADKLRRVMTHARRRQDMEAIGQEFIRKAIEHGVSADVAETIFSYIVGYAGYGFCEAHAAAFGDTAYRTAYLLRHYPAEFYAAILSNQPMGCYPPNTICLEARRRGVSILPPDINASDRRWLAENGAIRVS
ncbi:MAG: DNA polymerase III subunit alpha, partial [Armatimonadota bacterium]